MFQDDLSVPYSNSFFCRTPEKSDVALIYQGSSLLAKSEQGTLLLPHFADLSEECAVLSFHCAFTLGDVGYFVADGSVLFLADEQLIDSRVFRELAPKEAVFAAAVGHSLYRWYQSNCFCGRCGKEMQDSETERAMVCPDCGLTVYPKICPAVIVAVTGGDRLVLTRYKGRPFKRYALVAGFNEIGESIEDTVRREVMEEVGLKVKNLRFYKSQPWVFTDSLLMGFFCELDGDDKITLQEDELAEAEWFERKNLPDDHSGISLTGEMIEVFRKGLEKKDF